MSKILTNAAIFKYKEQGYHFPLRILDDDQVAQNRHYLESFESAQGNPLEAPNATSRTCCSSGSTISCGSRRFWMR